MSILQQCNQRRSIPLEPIGIACRPLSQSSSDSKLLAGPSSSQRYMTEMTVKHLNLTRGEVSFLIGAQGKRIAEMRRLTNANIKVVPLQTSLNGITNIPKPRNDKLPQFIRISGTKQQVNETTKIIHRELEQFNF
ncbi:CYFA0S13e03356g1_1 [Cyberlindnera fabianii]|uniref:CYFA0S13e03356g1_1 n=1 Tax=Cyberlindnera fabianii TaxID=36022 RepID=A0A061B2S6_CYBFA|nr:CYFA0S13e03356g1_1 [Cyberlindnera fabianii]